MHFLISSTLSLDVIAMAASIALVIWSYQIKNGNTLAMVAGVLLFIISFLSITSTGFFGGRYLMMGEQAGMMMEHKMMEHMPNQEAKPAQ